MLSETLRRRAALVALAALALGGCALRDALRFQRALDAEAAIARTHGESVRDLARGCGLCHGVEGNGASERYPHLAGLPQAYLEAQLEAFASGARTAPQMQPLAANLSPEQRRAISAYYASFAAAPSSGGRRDRPADARAAALAEPCKACHGDAFEGRPALGPPLAGQAREYVAQQLLAFRSGARSDPQGVMAAAARPLGDADVERLAEFLAGLDPTRDTETRQAQRTPEAR